jgi:serine phosphatase RsbU (regulator of sigma subunit)
MQNLLYAVAKKLWPDLETMNEQRRMQGVGEVITFLVSFILALVGLIWLLIVTDTQLLIREWQPVLLMTCALILFERINYFIIIEIRTDRYGSADGSMASVIQWSAVLLFGPSALWISIFWRVGVFIKDWSAAHSISSGWNILRNFAMDLSIRSLAYLVALTFYQKWGGVYPIEALTPRVVILVFMTLGLYFICTTLIWSVYIGYVFWMQKRFSEGESTLPLARFFLLVFALPHFAHPFAILVAGLYIQNGVLIDLYFLTGLLLVAYLTRRLSWAVETSRQQSRQLRQLEHLSREILNAPPDASALPKLLGEHVSAMFPSARMAIGLSDGEVLLKKPDDWDLDLTPVQAWVCKEARVNAYLNKESLPWDPENHIHDPVVTAAIFDLESGAPVGCIYIELRSLSQPWDRQALTTLFPAVKTLADQVASALHQAKVYEETLAYQRTTQELAFAGKIQSSFLPNEMPRLKGWELAVTLLPARETSGDFFDFIPLPNGKIGILVADVADKGLGAALYMALSRTLIRTYAIEYVDSPPEVIFFSANERILQDARANLFVTAFYGILDQETGILTYCNAGHNPPYLFNPGNGNTVTSLPPTGMPMGIEENALWQQATIQMQPGDVLVLYTDGITDALNEAEEFFKEERLVETVLANLHLPAQELQTAIMNKIQEFVGEASQFDDITLLILRRDLEG